MIIGGEAQRVRGYKVKGRVSRGVGAGIGGVQRHRGRWAHGDPGDWLLLWEMLGSVTDYRWGLTR